MLLLLYLSAVLDNIMDSYATCLWNLTVCILSGLLLLRPTQMTYIFFTWSILVCLQDDEDLFQTYVIATVLSTGGSSALLDDVMDSYATCLWNLIVFILGGLLLLGAMPI